MSLRTLITLYVVANCLGGSTSDSQPPVDAALSFTSLPAERTEICRQTFEIQGRETNTPLVFCQRNSTDSNEYEATILRYRKGNWEMSQIPEIRNHSWVHVAREAGSGRIWALAQKSNGDSGDTFEVIFTPDGGNTWEHVASVKKVYYMADFTSFRMNSKGEGSIAEQLEPDLNIELKGGYYTHYTKDWGHTWSKPEYTEDVLDTHRVSVQDRPIAELLEELTPPNKEKP